MGTIAAVFQTVGRRFESSRGRQSEALCSHCALIVPERIVGPPNEDHRPAGVVVADNHVARQLAGVAERAAQLRQDPATADDPASHCGTLGSALALPTSDGWQKLIAPDKKARTKRDSFRGGLRA